MKKIVKTTNTAKKITKIRLSLYAGSMTSGLFADVVSINNELNAHENPEKYKLLSSALLRITRSRKMKTPSIPKKNDRESEENKKIRNSRDDLYSANNEPS
mmetsp:Transcript_15274/g.23130  ORF Transcript_15274/g.23130 Transcript_15274/m.23130 type:complete len:101 (-) Transcript_15274:634-936(-)